MRSIATVALTLATSVLLAADEVVLRERFERIADGRLPDGWSTDGAGWSVQDGRLRGAVSEGESTILFGDAEWRDVALTADVKFTGAKEGTRWVAFLLRDAGPDLPGIQFTARRDTKRGNGLELAARRPKHDGGGWHVFQTAAAPETFMGERPHHLRIEARGDWIRAFFDDQKVFECPRGPDVSTAGRVGFRISGATVEIDNVQVSRLDPMTPTQLHRLRTRPLVVAHRGFSHRAPENTLAAYQLAIDAGAEMAECDVWLSSDRIPVLLHDADLQRTTGVEGQVNALTLAELKRLDAGGWKAPEFAGERIPTLHETLNLVSGKLRLVIEIKPAGMEREVVAAIHKAGVKPSDVMIFSFKREVVDTMARLEPSLPTTWLVGDMPWQPAARLETLAEALRARASAIGLPLTRVDPAVLRLAHESGLSVFVWTVNEPADMRYLARIGVDGIITDRPDLLLQALEQPE
jgi:glycerophosphoryl diester phosphodiesterase